ncbi:MAG: HEAT repeat domain-containing protein, partial [Simkania negevensis]|nr:HEAT repeat domain-containing protein [Simkania negevensis]
LYPKSERLREAYIRVLADSGQDDEAVIEWKRWGKKEKALSDDLLEKIAWGILSKSENSPQLIINVASLMSAYATQDVRATFLLKHQMHSNNAFLRYLAVKLSGSYRDQVLISEMQKLLRREKVWFVRLEVIRTLGSLEVKEAREDFKAILAKEESSLQEKEAALTALVIMYEKIEEEEFFQLLHSNRAEMRSLLCGIIGHLDLKEKLFALEKLLDDCSPFVRITALNTLSTFELKEIPLSCAQRIVVLSRDPHPGVSITAAWLGSRFLPKEMGEVFKRWVYSSDAESRRLAAYALSHCGREGNKIAKEVLKITPDPFVKANIALGMIEGREEISLGGEILYSFLVIQKDKMMLESGSNPMFHILSPSEIRHTPHIPQYPSLVDLLTRLQIYNLLAVVNFPKAEEAVKSFLKNRILGVSYAASGVLLEEGGEDALAILRALLKEKEENVRVQSALVLALSGREKEAITVLQEVYPSMDREMKINILGALGHVGDRASLPFLLEKLEEPYQILRVVAASALIQCLYH